MHVYKDHYTTLGISSDATVNQIRKAYKKKALQFHPDKNKDDGEQFKEVQTAYDILSDESTRKQYDETLSLMTIATLVMGSLNPSKPPNHEVEICICFQDIYDGKCFQKEIEVIRKNRTLFIFEPYLETVHIDFSNGWQSKYVFSERGDESLMYRGRGDLIVHIQITCPMNVEVDTILSSYDVMYTRHTSLCEYYTCANLACNVYLSNEHKEKNEFSVRFEGLDRCVVMHNMGLPFTDDKSQMRGALYVYFKLDLPTIAREHLDDVTAMLTKYFS